MADSVTTCPHCGSQANHLRRIRPSLDETRKIRQEVKRGIEKNVPKSEKNVQIGCFTLIALFIIIMIAFALAPQSEYDKCMETNNLSSDWDDIYYVMGQCSRYKD